jgi:hypothetical protein
MTGPTEHAEAAMLMRAVRSAEALWPELALFHAIPNGGMRSKRTAIGLKAEGVRPGVPDYCLPVARGGYHGLYIELKTASGAVRPEQRAWLAALAAQGYMAVVCRQWEQAWGVLRDYLAADAQEAA